jgi:hypothetical protein
VSKAANIADARRRRQENQPHEVCEVMCWHCGDRHISVHPYKTIPMRDWPCPKCGKAGGMFRTGQPVDDDVLPSPGNVPKEERQ